jgi:hypothetical protein
LQRRPLISGRLFCVWTLLCRLEFGGDGLDFV